jgi:small subunit ribosomal protein S27e
MSGNIIQSPKSRFVHVMCKKCKNEQVIYNKAATVVKCTGCGIDIARPTGGEISLVNAKYLEILG